ncbi:DUF547 domain-containing protein [Marinomonas sp. 15G1-11]|uniref:DUF547 domain-containing protein n=1 Tax=Marinomonas phaeophyticola TaxID=3004091 RepID=A0ABT4JVB7_9GAMM|nr:DUF547 domain-containing protein [Marinomonas sp. 15G1-11]MCZ2722191.1 DUF547 domain-containing protein [Marinomonas sp. 15G1-11]
MKFLLFIILNSLVLSNLWAAPAKDLDKQWAAFSQTSTLSVSHDKWQAILDRYLTTTPDEQTFFSYSKVTSEDHKLLKSYVSDLTTIAPEQLTRIQQKAYWINLYNAKTVDLILDNYPTKSITKLGQGFFSFGPWDDKVLTINDKKITLNDIEHRILRPIYNDARIHYAVNCASYSCPNLAAHAYTAENTEQLLDKGAEQYINHPRGVLVTDEGLKLSTIYSWYQVDFGGNEQDLIKHLSLYAKPKLKEALSMVTGKIEYVYNWDLNEIK